MPDRDRSRPDIQFRVDADLHPASWAWLRDVVLPAIATLDHPVLARCSAIDEARGHIVWSIAQDVRMMPLSEVPLPLAPERVRAILQRLVDACEALHGRGLGALRLTLDGVFVSESFDRVVFAPSPWLDRLAVRSSVTAVPTGHFMAPELSAPGPELPADRRLCDVFALGALASFLLIGRSRGPDELPGGVDPALAGWDRLIDRSTRVVPRRRYESLAAARADWPPPDERPAPRPEAAEITGTPRVGRGVQRVAVVAALLGLSLAGLLMLSRVGWRHPGTASGGAVTGFGDTVVRYADRTYAGAAWTEVQAAASLSTLAGLGSGVSLARLHGVAGVDDRNLWVVDVRGLLFRKSAGHWTYEGAVAGGMAVQAFRPLSADAVAFGAARTPRFDGTAFALWEPKGTRVFKNDNVLTRGTYFHTAHISAVARDFAQYYANTTRGRGSAHQLLGNGFSHLRGDRDKAFFLHRDDNTPLRDFPAYFIRHTATFQEGREAYALWHNPRTRSAAVAEFRDGLWVLRGTIQRNLAPMKAAWFGQAGGAPFVVVAGTGGFVLRHVLGGETTEQSVSGSLQATTSGDLIAVWGRGADHYWVMDSNGSVWERSSDRWRAVVRGLYDEDVVFRDAYVAPSGTVYAVTNDTLYRLQ